VPPLFKKWKQTYKVSIGDNYKFYKKKQIMTDAYPLKELNKTLIFRGKKIAGKYRL
jgi:hypothetical protein